MVLELEGGKVRCLASECLVSQARMLCSVVDKEKDSEVAVRQ